MFSPDSLLSRKETLLKVVQLTPAPPQPDLKRNARSDLEVDPNVEELQPKEFKESST